MPYYPLFYENDIPDDISDIVSIAKYFGITIDNQAIWNIARLYEQPPHLGNIYLELLFTSLANKLKAIYPELIIDYEVNALASYFNVNGERLYSLNQLVNCATDN